MACFPPFFVDDDSRHPSGTSAARPAPTVVNAIAPNVSFGAKRTKSRRQRADTAMFTGHDPYLVALSVVIASLGGYTGFGLAARIRATPGASRRLLLAGAAGFLAVGVWTMHFIGMLAAPLPPDAVYLVLPTIVSFLICTLVVGVSVFFVSIGEPSVVRVTTSALLLGVGIASMHYVGIHGLSGDFHIEHDPAMVGLAVLIAIGTAYGGLKIFLARQGGLRLMLSAIAFGIAVSGMHYTAMYGMHFRPEHEPAHAIGGPAVSTYALTLIVSLLCFLVVAAFLLFLVPEPRRRTADANAGNVDGPPVADPDTTTIDVSPPAPGRMAGAGQRLMPAPLGGLGQPPRRLRRACRSRAPTGRISSTWPMSAASGRRSRHGAPERRSQKMPLSTRRSFTRRTPRGLFGSIGLMAVHSKALSS